MAEVGLSGVLPVTGDDDVDAAAATDVTFSDATDDVSEVDADADAMVGFAADDADAEAMVGFAADDTVAVFVAFVEVAVENFTPRVLVATVVVFDAGWLVASDVDVAIFEVVLLAVEGEMLVG